MSRKCTKCNGHKTITVTVTERDVTSSIIYGVGLGMGYFPSTKTVTKKEKCPRCKGTGNLSDEE